MKDKKLIIKCPYCGAEYIPSELYYPQDFLPNCYDMVKDESGKIIGYNGNVMNLSTEYTCDVCNHTFKVNAAVSFTVEKAEEHDFEYDCTLSLYDRERVELEEN